MTKPALYAVAGSALPRAARCLALAVLWLAGATGAVAQEPVCGACVALEITATQTVALPPQLDGLPVLVRVPAGSEATAREALVAISNRGGHAGLIVSGLPSTTLPQDVIAQADLVLIDLTTASGDDPRQVAFAPEDPEHRGACRGQGWSADWDRGGGSHGHGPPRTGSRAVSGFRVVARRGACRPRRTRGVANVCVSTSIAPRSPGRDGHTRRAAVAVADARGRHRGCAADDGCRAGGVGAAIRPRSFGTASAWRVPEPRRRPISTRARSKSLPWRRAHRRRPFRSRRQRLASSTCASPPATSSSGCRREPARISLPRASR